VNNPKVDRANQRWVRAAQLATIIALPVAIIGVLVARNGPQAGSASPHTTMTGVSAPSSPVATSPVATGTERPLADLLPKSGQNNITLDKDPAGAVSAMTIHCGSGDSNDRFREVEYTLNGAYSNFVADVMATVNEPEYKTQFQVFGDDVQADNKVLSGSQPNTVQAPVAGKKTMRLRLTCQDSNATLILRNARIQS
jgi:NPCBM/NEW2 domain